MTEATTNPCKALNCECVNFTEAPSMSGIWKVCGVVGCSHTIQSHGLKPDVKVATVSAPKPATDAQPTVSAPKPAASSERLSSASNAYSATPADMRAWLRANGYSPGARGRIHPEHRKAFEAAHAK